MEVTTFTLITGASSGVGREAVSYTHLGVPTLTIAGLTPASRQGSAIMSQLGLEGFIASSAADFTDKGAYWAAHLEELAAIRAALRERCLLYTSRCV